MPRRPAKLPNGRPGLAGVTPHCKPRLAAAADMNARNKGRRDRHRERREANCSDAEVKDQIERARRHGLFGIRPCGQRFACRPLPWSPIP